MWRKGCAATNPLAGRRASCWRFWVLVSTFTRFRSAGCGLFTRWRQPLLLGISYAASGRVIETRTDTVGFFFSTLFFGAVAASIGARAHRWSFATMLSEFRGLGRIGFGSSWRSFPLRLERS